MKLIIAIIQDEDAGEVISHLNEAEIQGTRLQKAVSSAAAIPPS